MDFFNLSYQVLGLNLSLSLTLILTFLTLISMQLMINKRKSNLNKAFEVIAQEKNNKDYDFVKVSYIITVFSGFLFFFINGISEVNEEAIISLFSLEKSSNPMNYVQYIGITFLGLGIGSFICVVSLLISMNSSHKILISYLITESQLKIIVNSAGINPSFELLNSLHNPIENIEAGRELFKRLPDLHKYEELLDNERPLRNSILNERHEEIFSKYKDALEIQKSKVAEMVPVIYETMNLENKLTVIEKRWESLESELKNIDRKG